MGAPTKTVVRCLDCGRPDVPVKVKANAAGRLYYVCSGRHGCGAKHDFEPEMTERDIPAAFEPRGRPDAPRPAAPEPGEPAGDPPHSEAETSGFDPFDPRTW